MRYHPKLLALVVLLFAAPQLSAQSQPVDLQSKVSVPFRFIAYGDTRFTDPSDTEASNAPVRRALVQGIDAAHPDFVSIGGDITYNGNDPNDWKTWDEETAAWRQHNITVYPALGNHDLHGDQKIALANYFQRFPELHESRYYSVRAANVLMLILDSSLDELSGPQGDWLAGKLDHLPDGVEFVVLVMHHPPYTSSSDTKVFGGGHSIRSAEKALAKMIEARQEHAGVRFVVFGSHVHNYERHERGGVTYFVTGGGGAHAYPIEREPNDLYPDKRINYHYLLARVDRGKIVITMNRIELTDGKADWTQPDSVAITVPALAHTKAAAH